ncbi:MAG: helix-turn-helix transcriptional regulator [Flavobacteriaceae bacterium]|nr:helix-turn-helix transcriptional regulator [Flavobacteriaceae bacterium]
MSEIQQNLAKNLKEIRKEKGLHQSQIAKKSGVIASTYSRIETCNVSPNLTTLISIAEALEVPMAELFKRTELKDKTLIQKLEMINGLSEYNRSVVEILLDSIIEKDKLEKSQEVKMKSRLAELDRVRKKS